jgi:hypothetical protein
MEKVVKNPSDVEYRMEERIGKNLREGRVTN